MFDSTGFGCAFRRETDFQKLHTLFFLYILEVIIDYECVRVKVSFFVSTPEETTCLSVLKSW